MKRRYNYDYSKLRGKLKEKSIIYKSLGSSIGLSVYSISERLNNNAQFSQEEIEKTMKLLDIPLEQVEQYFFTHIVQKTKL